ncbi:MAG: hypothetical protein AB9872_13885 [Solidesulfovibrio sp.]
METLGRNDKDKEVFRLWYECLLRTNMYWNAYHVYSKWRVAKDRGLKVGFVKEIKELISLSVTDVKWMEKFVSDVFFFMSDHLGFMLAQDIGFDEAWPTIKKSPEKHCSDTIITAQDAVRRSVKESIDEITSFTAFNRPLNEHEELKFFHNIKTGPSDYGDEWSLVTDFDVNCSQLEKYVESLPIFNSKCMRINLSIYPFGKTKKELLNDIWSKIAPFRSDKTKKRKHLDCITTWVAPCGPVYKDEIKRYLGVYDIMRSRKMIKYKDIINGDFPNVQDEFTDEVKKHYTSTSSRPIDEKNKDILDSLGRDHSNAKKMISNALAGYFPKYPKKETPAT